MRVAINICGIDKNDTALTIDIVIDLITTIAINHPENNFIFISDKLGLEDNITFENCINIIVKPKPTSTLLWQYWYNTQIAKILKKYQVDIVINTDMSIHFNSQIPVLLFVKDLIVLHKKIKKPKYSFYKKNTNKLLQNATRIVTTSSFLKKILVEKYTINDTKIDVAFSSINKKFEPIIFDEKESIKHTYSAGKEYFLYYGKIDEEHNLLTLLKAFSFFKKRQKSNMQLLIVSTNNAIAELKESLRLYKYREDVNVLIDLSLAEQAKILAAAYAFVYPSFYETFTPEIIAAMQSEVPVIASDIESIKEIAGDTILYVDPNNFEDVANKMMILFKEENNRKDWILKGAEQAKKYSTQLVASLLWQSIVKATVV